MKHKAASGVSKLTEMAIVLVIIIILGYFIVKPESLINLLLGSFGATIFVAICNINTPSSYVDAIRSTYQKNIKEALKTEYPHGIVYILENTLKELDKLGLDLDPDSRYFPGDDNKKAGTYGFPNKTNLKETIKMARELSKDWEQLDALEPAKASQYMAAIRTRIQQEDLYLWTSIKPKSGQDIYYYSYGEEDYQAEKQLGYGSYQSFRASNKHHDQDHDLENISKDNQNANILDFPDWLAQNSALQYVSDLEQKKAYTRYTRSVKTDEEKPYYS